MYKNIYTEQHHYVVNINGCATTNEIRVNMCIHFNRVERSTMKEERKHMKGEEIYKG